MCSNTPGVQFVDSAGQVGWTPVVKRKQRRKSTKNGTEIDSDADSDEELRLRYTKQVVFKKVDGIPGLSFRRGNTNHRIWSPIMPSPIAHRTRTKTTCILK